MTPAAIAATAAGGHSASALANGVVPLIKATAWPLIVLLLILILAFTKRGRGIINSLSSRVSGVKLGPFQVDLTQEAAGRAKITLDDTFSTFRKAINSEFDRAVYAYGIDARLQSVLESVFQTELDQYWKTKKSETEYWKKNEHAPPYRCTIHVLDLLFDGALYQLLDYYPSGRGRGRAFSIRFGAIGTAWRLGRHIYDGEVSTEAERLIKEWGMTRREATGERGRNRRSFACIVLRDGGAREEQPLEPTNFFGRYRQRQSRIRRSKRIIERRAMDDTLGDQVGLLYLDCEQENAFDLPAGAASFSLSPMLEQLRQAAVGSGLVADLADMGRNLRERGPALRLFAEGE
jgi:hypothetical protein